MSDYLRASAPTLQSAIDAHREFTRQLTPLYQQASSGHAASAAIKARTLGKQYAGMFNHHLKKVGELAPPQSAVRANEYFTRWLQFLISACDALTQAQADGRDSTYLRDCHDFLDDARYAAKALAELRQRLHEAVVAAAKSAAASQDPRASAG